jgi:hypothetical protein
MEDLNASSGWLSREELIFDRMVTFHRRRVAEIAEGKTRFLVREGGGLIVHLIPQECVERRLRFDGATLEKASTVIHALGERGSRSRFNAEGWIHYYGEDKIRNYTQLYWDGRLEAAMSDIAYQRGGAFVFRSIVCEKAIFELAISFGKFYSAIGLTGPVWLFSALTGCEGFRFAIHPIDASRFDIDRSPAFLPEIEIATIDGKPQSELRSWCDSFWQAAGEPRSLDFDADGNWRERR